MFKKLTLLLLLASLFATSCSKYQRLKKSTDYEEKYQMAFVYFNQRDYFRAIELFESVIPFFRGTERAENIAYHYAFAHYYKKDYILASFYFKRFITSFPRSKHVEECTFMTAYCKYLDSPKYSLDQTNTKEAIQELQLFINKFPESERVAEANQLIDGLRSKLERKEMEIARLYYRMGNYTASITSFKNLLRDFPDTDFREEIMFTILKAHYDFAVKSIETRKQERFEEALEAYDNFTAQFPDSFFAREAARIQRSASNQLNSLANQTP
jgi:outer membrane protein assembly factor BamD